MMEYKIANHVINLEGMLAVYLLLLFRGPLRGAQWLRPKTRTTRSVGMGRCRYPDRVTSTSPETQGARERPSRSRTPLRWRSVSLATGQTPCALARSPGRSRSAIQLSP